MYGEGVVPVPGELLPARGGEGEVGQERVRWAAAGGVCGGGGVGEGWDVGAAGGDERFEYWGSGEIRGVSKHRTRFTLTD